jgi:hypothetical protein
VVSRETDASRKVNDNDLSGNALTGYAKGFPFTFARRWCHAKLWALEISIAK